MKSCRIAAVLFALVWLAACATTTNGTVAAADRLAHSAETFATTTCPSPSDVDACSGARYFTAADQFVDQASEFRETADTGTALQILSSFERLWHGYHKLRHEVSRSDNATLEAAFEPTTRAFKHVQQCVKQRYSDADRFLLSRGGYMLDPYYN